MKTITDININEVLKYCIIWRTRKEIMEKFELSPVESWHITKFIKKLPADFQHQKRQGFTGRSEMYKARQSSLDELNRSKL